MNPHQLRCWSHAYPEPDWALISKRADFREPCDGGNCQCQSPRARGHSDQWGCCGPSRMLRLIESYAIGTPKVKDLINCPRRAGLAIHLISCLLLPVEFSPAPAGTTPYLFFFSHNTYPPALKFIETYSNGPQWWPIILRRELPCCKRSVRMNIHGLRLQLSTWLGYK